MSVHKTWKGHVQLGLISIPCYLTTAARDQHTALRQLHAPCGTPVKMPHYCPNCSSMIPKEEIVKGFETPKGFVRLTEAEMDGITPASGKVIEIGECVKWADVDPVYLAESYYLLPEPAGAKAYALLVRALRESGRVAIATVSKSRREHVILLRPRGNGLMVHCLYYAGEVNQVAEFEALPEMALKPVELNLATQLVESLAADFDPAHYHDAYGERLKALIASKVDPETPPPAPVKPQVVEMPDMLGALKASLKQRAERKQGGKAA